MKFVLKVLFTVHTVQSAWCEVRATDVIRCMQGQEEPIPVRVCSMSKCDGCKQKLEQQVMDLQGRTLAEKGKTADLKRASEELETATEERIREDAALTLLRKRKRIFDIGGGTMLNFGEHKGLALEAVFKEDPVASMEQDGYGV